MTENKEVAKVASEPMQFTKEETASPELMAAQLESEVAKLSARQKRAQVALDRQSVRARKALNRHDLRTKYINAMARGSTKRMTVDQLHELALQVNEIDWTRNR